MDRAVWRACPDGGVSSCVRDYLGPAGTRRRAPARGPAKVEVGGGGCDEIGLGAITDTVQQAYGPVAFDRSLVELAMLPTPRQGCPACAGRRFNFPADLNGQ